MTAKIDPLWRAVVEASLKLVDERNHRTARQPRSQAQWLADRTLRLNLGSACGQSSFIARYASEFDLIVVDSSLQAESFRRQQTPKADLATARSFWDSQDKLHYSRIWFDNVTALDDALLAHIYSRTSQTNTRWILLGGNNV